MSIFFVVQFVAQNIENTAKKDMWAKERHDLFPESGYL